ncbi:hypothetical protein LTR53_005516 [Teratosphaeriaceae sp. CCFEE 6253]|nr:hypothetical protein LTR53_005516 [Teratosphaeriaceae sp. CCFEE 6253]
MLIRRLAQVEEQLESVKAVNARPAHSPGQQPRHGATDAERQTPMRAESLGSQEKRVPQGQGPIWAEGSAFAGETSARYNLDQMEGRLDRLGVMRSTRPSSPPTHPLTRSVTPERGASALRTDGRRDGNLQRLFHRHGISVDDQNWQGWLTSFFTDVHPLYPFLHPPSVWGEYCKMWNVYLSCRSFAALNEDDADLKLAQIFLVLAVGRCTATRTGNDGRHSAGWSFYCVAADLVGDALNLCGNRGCPLLQLQTLCLMIVYLFRLDANERAQNVLALAVSHAHSLGINRNAILAKMPHFQDEMFRRVWWCVYVLDRRLCLETGRPFLILDLNADTNIPSELSDSWLSAHRLAKDTTLDLGATIREELHRCSESSVSYLQAMIEYSRITGKVWEAVYAVPVAEQPLTGLQREYIELLLNRWQGALPAALVYQDTPEHDVSTSGPRVIVLQGFLLYLPATNDLESSFTCMRLAHVIIDAFTSISPLWSVLKFPFIPYLLGATMASLSVLITEPTLRPNYAEATVQAAKLLKQSCHASWVSRKTALTVARLHALVISTLLPPHEARASAMSVAGAQRARPSRSAGRGVEGEQWRPSPPALGPGGQISPVSAPRDSGLAPSGKTLGRDSNNDFRMPGQAATRRDRQSAFDAQANRDIQPASDLDWQGFDVGDFDFEQAISGGQLMNSRVDHEMLMPWSGGTGSWLDGLLDVTPDTNFQSQMHLDPSFLANSEGLNHFAYGGGTAGRRSD